MKKQMTTFLTVLLCAAFATGCTTTVPASSVPAKPGTTGGQVASSEAASSTVSDASSAPATEAGGIPAKMILGLDASFPPMGFTDETNKVVGADIDLAMAVCEKLGIEFEAKPISWDSKEMELASDKINCIWNGMTITDERIEIFSMSRPYMQNDQVIVVMNDSPIKTKADLKDKKVAAQKDSSGLSALEKDEIYSNIANAAAVQYDDYVIALGDLEVGRVDAIVMDSVVANYYITKNNKQMTILADKMSAEEYGIGFKKGNDVYKDAVEKAMSELAAEGKIAEISKKWFGKEDMILTY